MTDILRCSSLMNIPLMDPVNEWVKTKESYEHAISVDLVDTSNCKLFATFVVVKSPIGSTIKVLNKYDDRNQIILDTVYNTTKSRRVSTLIGTGIHNCEIRYVCVHNKKVVGTIIVNNLTFCLQTKCKQPYRWNTSMVMTTNALTPSHKEGSRSISELLSCLGMDINENVHIGYYEQYHEICPHIYRSSCNQVM